jgi:hypothetical protein
VTSRYLLYYWRARLLQVVVGVGEEEEEGGKRGVKEEDA